MTLIPPHIPDRSTPQLMKIWRHMASRYNPASSGLLNWRRINMKQLSVLGCFLLFVVAVYGDDLASEFTNSASLDEDSKVRLYWSVDWDEKTVHFAVQAQTTGWVGFGISTGQGKMKGADIVIGWVKEGKTYFSVSQRKCPQTELHGTACRWYCNRCTRLRKKPCRTCEGRLSGMNVACIAISASSRASYCEFVEFAALAEAPNRLKLRWSSVCWAIGH